MINRRSEGSKSPSSTFDFRQNNSILDCVIAIPTYVGQIKDQPLFCTQLPSECESIVLALSISENKTFRYWYLSWCFWDKSVLYKDAFISFIQYEAWLRNCALQVFANIDCYISHWKWNYFTNFMNYEGMQEVFGVPEQRIANIPMKWCWMLLT